MPRPRLTYDQAVTRGTAQVNAGRFASRKNAPPTVGCVGDPPEYFDAELQQTWDELVSSIPEGVAGSSDRQVIEMASRLLHQFRTDPKMHASRISILTNLLSRLGLDPQARTRIQVEQPTEKPRDAFDEFMQCIGGE